MPFVPSSAASPATADPMASTVSPMAPASVHQSPVITPSQLWAIAVAATPTSPAAPTRVRAAREPRSPMRVIIAPAATPARARGRMLAPRAAPRGSAFGAATTSVTGTAAPAGAAPLTASVSSWATTGLAAEAVSSCGPLPVTTTAPYTTRSPMASRAAAASAYRWISKAPSRCSNACCS